MAPVLFFLLVTTISLAHGFRLQSAGCQVDINEDLAEPQPLLIQPGGALDVTGFLQPNEKGIVYLTSGQKVIVACSGTDNYLSPFSEELAQVTATCVSGTTFTINNKRYELSDVVCSFKPSHNAFATGNKCYGNNIEIYIGFNVSRAFYKTIDVCFDQKLLGPLYSHTTVVAGIGGYETGVDRADFKPAGFYGSVSPESQFKRASEISTIGKLLGSADLGKKYISNTNDYFLARGHLAAKADFVFGNQHRATFYYVNVAPQWQTFNGGNWAVLEQDVRQLASDRGVDLEVYTGTHGIATLPDVNGNDTPLYLHADGMMPIPQFFWKVVYLSQSRAAVAFVGINNPYVRISQHPELILCPDVSDEIGWVSWDPKSVKRGEGYICEVAALRKMVPSIPNISVNKLLT
ncbi:uncharacterized protein [Anabrus simplex]|uniref:DsRNase 2 n=1 Tax=Anabrus simplex TaxID=316456 RepID=A0AA95FJP1_ANASP|nr:dsRNase 2 [Anabrus simplex]